MVAVVVVVVVVAVVVVVVAVEVVVVVVVVDVVTESLHLPSLHIEPSLHTFISVVPSLQKHCLVTGWGAAGQDARHAALVEVRLFTHISSSSQILPM